MGHIEKLREPPRGRELHPYGIIRKRYSNRTLQQLDADCSIKKDING
jgi:hypothetical protein